MISVDYRCRAIAAVKEHLRAVFSSFPQVLLVRSAFMGVLMFAVLLTNPDAALAGLLSVLAAYLFARFINLGGDFLRLGFYTYNPLLVGLSIGYLFKFDLLTALMVVCAGVLTLVVTVVLSNLFWTYLKLPVLSLPFVIVSSAAYLAAPRYSNLFVHINQHAPVAIDLYLPLWLSGFLRSFGAILFAPNVAVGLVFAVIVILWSRILFMMAVLGYAVGTAVRGLMLGSFPQAFADVGSFNFILIAMVLGGVFLIPSVKSYLLAVIGVAVSSLLLDSMSVFWSDFGIPVFALPFNVVSLSMIYVLGLVGSPMVAAFIGKTPEETLDYSLSARLRYPGHCRALTLPFSGAWRVWQAFDGNWTHRSVWRYAYDFLIADDRGRTCRAGGGQLADFYAYGKPVVSPVRGRVVKVIDSLPDNPPGRGDRANNWGNLVLIQEDRGFFAELSHFAPGSITVSEGDWVEPGALLGRCGNSGYSPQPHIHLQVQATADVGSYTLPFSLAGYMSGSEFHSNDLPPENETVEPLRTDRRLDEVMSFVIDDRMDYEVLRGGEVIDRFSLAVKMATDGTFFLDSGRGRLYFGKYEGTFYFYRMEGRDPWLKAIFLAVPRLPLAYRSGVRWTDYVPAGLAISGLKRVIVRFFSAFYPSLSQVSVSLRWGGRYVIEGVVSSKLLNRPIVTRAEVDERQGFALVKVDQLELRRV